MAAESALHRLTYQQSLCCQESPEMLVRAPKVYGVHRHFLSGENSRAECRLRVSATNLLSNSTNGTYQKRRHLTAVFSASISNNSVPERGGSWVANRVKNSVHRPSFLSFPSLQADDFRHPLDRQNTALLRTLPGLNELGRFLLGPVAEEVLLLENIGTSVLVGENQLANLHRLMQEAAQILNVDPPDLYVRQNPVPNAYTLAMSGRKPFVVVHTSLIELLTPAEVQAVLAHELGHLKCDHGIWLTFANIIAFGAGSLPGLGALFARNLEDQLMRWVRSAELTCDRAALLVAQDPKVVVSVLMKLAGGCPSLADELNVDAFLQQARSYDEASSSLFGWYLRNAQTRQLSHPLPVMRAREIDQWARGKEYKALLDKARRVSSQKLTPSGPPGVAAAQA